MSIKSNAQRFKDEEIARQAVSVLQTAIEQFLRDAGIPDHGYFVCVFEKDTIGHVNVASNVPVGELVFALRDGANQLEKVMRETKKASKLN